MATIRQVAKECGVSAMTVSFVLNNKPGMVSAETRERVLQTVRDLGYSPGAVRGPAKIDKSVTFGVIPGISGSHLLSAGYYNSVVHGIVSAADTLCHNVMLFPHNVLHDNMQEAIRRYCDGHCDGVLILAPTPDNLLMSALKERGFPLVVIGNSPHNKQVSCIDVDNTAATVAIVEYLLQAGHRRVAYVQGPEYSSAAQFRRDAYLKTLDDHRITWSLVLAFGDLITVDAIFPMIEKAMGGSPEKRPTALFCWNDEIACVVLRVLKDLGYSVPRDISLVGFDDDPRNGEIKPALTTVRQPYDELGARGLEMLLHQIRDKNAAPQRILLPTEFIVRDSVGPPP